MTPNDPYNGRTAPLTSKRCILYIYSTNIGIEYFKHVIYSPIFFSSICSLFHNSNVFGSCIIHILYTGCANIKKKSGAKILITGFLGTNILRWHNTRQNMVIIHTNTSYPILFPPISLSGLKYTNIEVGLDLVLRVLNTIKNITSTRIDIHTYSKL